MHRNPYRGVDASHSMSLREIDFEDSTTEEIIEHPEMHLLTQRGVLEAEGGYLGLGVQIGAVVGGLYLLSMYRPTLIRNLQHGQLAMNEWYTLGGASFGSYLFGYYGGMLAFGDMRKRGNHHKAYIFQKTQNRFEGRRVLKKSPMMK